MLKIAVLIKQIPLIEDANFDAKTRTIRRDGPNVISAFDLRAVALAVDLKSRLGADTAVVTMGPPQARSALEDALAMGIDRAAHLEDRAFAGSDTLATARALTAWLRRDQFDLVLLGKYSLDAETGQVGPEIAELLGIAQVTGLRKLEIEGRRIIAERESDEGFEEVEAMMPAVLTCAERVAAPIRLKPGAREAAASKPIETVAAADLGSEAGPFGFKGSPTWVRDVWVESAPVTKCRFIDAADPDRAARDVVASLRDLGALVGRTSSRRPISPGMRAAQSGRDVWVACETDLSGRPTRGTLEMLCCGDELAARLGGALIGVGFPRSFAKHGEEVGAYGADRIIVLDHPALESYAPETVAEAMAQAVARHHPWGMLLAASERGRDWAPRMAARLGLGLTGDAIGIEIDGDDQMVALKPAFGGNIIAPILSRTRPQLATVRSGVFEMSVPAASRKPEIDFVRPELHDATSRLVRTLRLLDETIVPLEGAEFVVGVGTGVGGPEGVDRLSEFARAIGAAMCATRRVTDAGWMPRQLQVGLTGKAIAPRLYLGFGVRGAPNHTIGLKRAQTVVAVNSDPDAPIFDRADLGIVAEWESVISPLHEALMEALKR